MGTKTYTNTEKAEVVDVFLRDGIAAAMQHAGCSKQSVYNWVRQSIDVEKTPEELEQDALYQRLLRSSMQRRFLERIDDLLDRFDQPHFDYRGKDVVRVQWDVATSGDVRNYAIAIGTLLDKYRLELGEPTSRSHTRIDAESGVDGELRRTIGEWQQQLTSPDTP